MYHEAWKVKKFERVNHWRNRSWFPALYLADEVKIHLAQPHLSTKVVQHSCLRSQRFRFTSGHSDASQFLLIFSAAIIFTTELKIHSVKALQYSWIWNGLLYSTRKFLLYDASVFKIEGENAWHPFQDWTWLFISCRFSCETWSWAHNRNFQNQFTQRYHD